MPKEYLTPKLIKLFFTIVICLLLIFLNPKGLFSPVRAVFLTIAYPFQKTFYVLSRKTEEWGGFISSIGNLKKQNESLLKENNDLAGQVAQLKDEKNENEILRDQLKLAPRDKYELEASFVIGQDPEKLGGWILIDKGTLQGIQPGMPVIVSDGILVGKVEQVYPASAKVTLLSDSTSSINGVDLETGAKGIVKGEYGLGIVLDMVNQTDILNSGDTIVTSGLGNELPRGLLIGKIQELKSTDDKLFQQALVSSRVKYSKLETVLVLKNSK